MLFKRIIDWAVSITSFRSGDVIAVDGPNGTAKMPKDDLLKETAQNALAGNVALEFDTNRTSENPYKSGQRVLFTDNKIYRFRNDHYGPWNAQDVVETSVSDEIVRVDTRWYIGYYVGIDGNLTEHAQYEASDYIAIPPQGLFISTQLFRNTSISFYDEYKNFVGYHTEDADLNVLHEEIATRTTFEGAAYVRITNLLNNKHRGAWIANEYLGQNNELIASEFLSDKTYAAGDRCIKDNFLYRFRDNHSGAWDYQHVVKTSVSAEILRVDTKWTRGYFASPLGTLTQNPSYEVSDYIVIPPTGLFVTTKLFRNTTISFYDKCKNFIGYHNEHTDTNVEHSEVVTTKTFNGAAYIRISNVLSNAIRGAWIANELWDLAGEVVSRSVVAPQFSDATDYSAGERVFYEEILYRFRNDHPSGTFAENDVVATSVSEEIGRLDVAWERGKYINASGGVCSLAAYELSDYIAIPLSGLRISTYLATVTAIAFFDKDKTFIGAHPGITEVNSRFEEIVSRTTFEGAAYVRITNLLNNKHRGAWIANEYLEAALPDPENGMYCTYDGESEAAIFKKGIAIGDSLTAGVFNYDLSQGTHTWSDPALSWPTYYEKNYGVQMTNKGTGGATPETWYSLHSSDDLSGHDFAVICLGVNCAFHDHGGWTSASDEALKNIIAKLETDNPGIKIFVCTIFPSTSYSYPIIGEISEGIRNSVEEIQANDDNVYLVDLYEYGTTKKTKYWHGHATPLGYNRIAEDIFNYISYIISQAPTEFLIQFIGTNYSP